MTKGASGSAADVGLRCIARQPAQEPAQLLPLAHVASGADRGGAAVGASPPLGSCGGLTVLHQPSTAYHAERLIRGKVHA